MALTVKFLESTSNKGLVKNYYEALENEDMGEVVLIWIDIFNNHNFPPFFMKANKEDMASNVYREKGNNAYKAHKYNEALINYNKALVSAPKKSKTMKVALSNRSAIFFQAEIFSASLIDVEMCLSMGCPRELTKKITERKSACLSLKFAEEMATQLFKSKFSDDYFKFKVERNPKIPCVVSHVGIKETEEVIPSVVAIKDIEFGSVIAVEKAFVCIAQYNNHYTSCYYCTKMSLNLIPCDKCCYALFCSKTCKDTAAKEFHSIECGANSCLQTVKDYKLNLAFRAALKMKQSFKTWSEFIEAVDNFSAELKEKKSMGVKAFDSKEKFSVLVHDIDGYVRFGQKHCHGHTVAVGLFELDHYNSSFFPSSRLEKQLAMKTMGRLILELCVFSIPTKILNGSQNAVESTLGFHDTVNYGLFPFTGKLRHSCDPNVLVVGLNDKVALIAIKPIKAGTELKISYVLHWLVKSIKNNPERQLQLFTEYGIICECRVCTEKWSEQEYKKPLTPEQKTVWTNLKIDEAKDYVLPSEYMKHQKKVFKALKVFSSIPESPEYRAIFPVFTKMILDCMHEVTKNVILGKSGLSSN